MDELVKKVPEVNLKPKLPENTLVHKIHSNGTNMQKSHQFDYPVIHNKSLDIK